MKRRDFLQLTTAALALGVAPRLEAERSRPNVLFIAIDDLRPALGCYGDTTAITPNIDRLARRGIVFNRAYCQEAVCSPSRLSLITGRRPDAIKVWDLHTHFREAAPDLVTLPQHFKQHGYHTRSIGKILHGGGPPSKDPPSWSEDPLYDSARDVKMRYALPKNLQGKGNKRDSLEAAAVPDNAYVDGMVSDAAVKALKELKAREELFLGVGFRKPHLPFCAPKKYWDLYKREEIPAPVTASHPEGAPELAVRSWKELEGYRDIPSSGAIPKEKVQALRHGYYACISYIDAQVGKLLDELEGLKLAENTVIVLWGDHGFHLGEQGLWTKANTYELATRAPLILSIPGQAKTGVKTDALVEFVDLYPTLTETCGLPLPEGLEGLSMTPLLREPERPWKKAAFSQYPRDFTAHRHDGHGDVMGYALRSEQYRYVEWRNFKSGELLARELYDHRKEGHEMRNMADDPAFQRVVDELSVALKAGWKAALPPKQDLQ